MKSLFHDFRSSAIVRKMTLRLVLVEVLVLAVILTLSQFFLTPRLERSALSSRSAAMSYLSAQLESQVNNYASYSQFIIHTDAVRSAIGAYRQNPSGQNYNLLCLQLTQQLSSSKSIRGMQLQAEDGTVFRSVVNLRDSDFAQLGGDWYQNVVHGATTRFFSPIYDPGLDTPSHTLAYARSYIIGPADYVLTLFFNCADLTSVVDSAAASLDGITVTDYLETPFYEVGDIGDSHAVSADTTSPSVPYVKSGGGYYFFARVPSANWRLVGYCTREALMADYHSIFAATILLCAGLCVLTLLIAVPTMSRVVSPIHSLSQTMQKASAGDLTVTAATGGKDEIGELGRIFNDMLANLRDHMERQITFEANEQKMRYNLLLAQIDSHFIGNSMSAINSLARQGRTGDVIAVNTALLKIIQNNLRIRDLDITDTLAQEMDVVEQYWIITKIRQENHAQLVWQVPDELLEESVPKNIIQPLVENCLFHGLIDETTGEMNGIITVTASALPDGMRVEVRDNGKGIQPLMLDYLNSPDDTLDYLRERGRHVGLANIRQRLQYLYKKNCLHISCDGGTVVTLDIPRGE